MHHGASPRPARPARTSTFIAPPSTLATCATATASAARVRPARSSTLRRRSTTSGLERLTAEAHYRRLASEGELRDQLDRNPGKRGDARLATRARPTRRPQRDPLARRASDAPPAARQTAITRLRVQRADLRLRGRPALAFDGSFAVEVDGYDAHSGRAAFERDRLKFAPLAAHGVQVMPCHRPPDRPRPGCACSDRLLGGAPSLIAQCSGCAALGVADAVGDRRHDLAADATGPSRSSTRTRASRARAGPCRSRRSRSPSACRAAAAAPSRRSSRPGRIVRLAPATERDPRLSLEDHEALVAGLALAHQHPAFRDVQLVVSAAIRARSALLQAVEQRDLRQVLDLASRDHRRLRLLAIGASTPRRFGGATIERMRAMVLEAAGTPLGRRSWPNPEPGRRAGRCSG